MNLKICMEHYDVTTYILQRVGIDVKIIRKWNMFQHFQRYWIKKMSPTPTSNLAIRIRPTDTIINNVKMRKIKYLPIIGWKSSKSKIFLILAYGQSLLNFER